MKNKKLIDIVGNRLHNFFLQTRSISARFIHLVFLRYAFDPRVRLRNIMENRERAGDPSCLARANLDGETTVGDGRYERRTICERDC